MRRDGVTLGIDLGATTVRAAVVDEGGRLIGQERHRLQSKEPPQVAEAIVRASKTACAAAGLPFSEMLGLGLAVDGRVHKATGVITASPALGWRDVPLLKLLQARVPKVPIALTNDLAAVVWAERMAGAAKGVDDLLVVLLGSHVGCGLVLGGRLQEGWSGLAGDLAHSKVSSAAPDPQKPAAHGRQCGCGQRGCLDAYATSTALCAWARDDIRIAQAAARAAGKPNLVGKRLLDLVGGDPDKITAAAMERAAHEGDELSRRLLDEAARMLGFSVANLLTMLNPQRLLLGGGLLSSSPRMMRLAQDAIDLYASKAARISCTVGAPALGDDAGVVGAALLAREAA
ncbi:MAG: ROK family protein [Deltaproteobacteria bacterium]|nr:ROK family protein [Deltaproteobacteria bacterium]